jgi:hypothetical protein
MLKIKQLRYTRLLSSLIINLIQLLLVETGVESRKE